MPVPNPLQPGEEPFEDPTSGEVRAAGEARRARPVYNGPVPGRLGRQWDHDPWDQDAAAGEAAGEARASRRTSNEVWESMDTGQQRATVPEAFPPEGDPVPGMAPPPGYDKGSRWGSSDDGHDSERRVAFSFGLGHLASQLHSISERQGDLHAASRRFF